MRQEGQFTRTTGRHAIAVGVLLAASLVLAVAAGPARAADAEWVDIVDFAFSPATITISVGDTVTWTNRDSVEHTATGAAGAPQPFDTGLLGTDRGGSVTFTAPGRYDYFCAPHPTMTGTVVVEPAGAVQVPNAALPQPPGAGGAGTYRGVGVLLVLTLVAAGTVAVRRRGRAG